MEELFNKHNFNLKNFDIQIVQEVFNHKLDHEMSPILHLLYGHYYHIHDNESKMIEHYTQCLPDGFYYIGYYYEMKKDHEKMVEWYQKGCDVEDEDCFYSLGLHYFKSNKYDLALQYFTYSDSLYYLGKCYYHLNQIDEMMTCYHNAIKAGNYKGYFYLADYYCIVRNTRLMKLNYEKAIQHDITDAMVSLAYYYRTSENNLDKAIHYCKLGSEKDPKCMYYLGVCYMEDRKYELAKDCFEKSYNKGFLKSLKRLVELCYYTKQDAEKYIKLCNENNIILPNSCFNWYEHLSKQNLFWLQVVMSDKRYDQNLIEFMSLFHRLSQEIIQSNELLLKKALNRYYELMYEKFKTKPKFSGFEDVKF